ncbi:S-adenosylmethionine:tRNA ribosyltransferase-isomerase [Streptomyces cavernae]|uniref:S-adenosylmethionine:tRNA ribosyltransferase-isomerase n=1 Tax=Streptomyces cavernae TaxID=2259034 RepID=UPI001391C1BD|nr:S-adenosylmethionine:tRNA ribosyltransferase-isomerase [Streptomyces cavernae]
MKPDELDFPMPPEIDCGGPAYEENFGVPRMATFEKASGEVRLGHVDDLLKHLDPGDLVVLNNSRVARTGFHGTIRSAEAVIELRGFIDGCDWAATVDSRVTVEPGDRIAADAVDFEIVRAAPGGTGPLWIIRFLCEESLMDAFLEAGHTNGDTRTEQGQAASRLRSVALPTASSILSRALLDELGKHGIRTAEVTLHAGLPSFEKNIIDEERIDLHRVPGERYSISAEAAEKINGALASGRRIVAVGTTVLRAVESAALSGLPLTARSEWTELAIYPGFTFRVCNGLMTGFHPSRSSHLALSAAFTGRDLLFRGYDEAVRSGYRFSPGHEITLTLEN